MGRTKAIIGVDGVLMSLKEGKLRVFLKKREKDPFKGKWELIGGLLNEDETVEEAMKRKMKQQESTQIHTEQFHTFSEPNRDPRERTVSVGFIALTNREDYSEGEWYPVNNLPELAFDHNSIIQGARKHLNKNALRLVPNLLETEFPINKLQTAMEAIENNTYDNRNFRKKMLASSIVEETGKLETNVSHRPAKLYKFK